MRKITLLLMAATTMFCACNNLTTVPATAPPGVSNADTTRTITRYLVGNSGQVGEGVCFRVVKDTVKVKDGQLVHAKDSTYYVPVADTVRKDGKVLYDSLARPVLTWKFFALPPAYVLLDYQKPMP